VATAAPSGQFAFLTINSTNPSNKPDKNQLLKKKKQSSPQPSTEEQQYIFARNLGFLITIYYLLSCAMVDLLGLFADHIIDFLPLVSQIPLIHLCYYLQVISSTAAFVLTATLNTLTL
jgi:hypothetical protein